MVKYMFLVERHNSNYVKNIDGLRDDFFEKCYICERKISDGESRLQIEHRIPKTADITDKNLLNDWNLFYACSRCNGSGMKGNNYYEKSCKCKYGNGYLGIIDCTNCDPHDYIVLKFELDLLRLGKITVTPIKNAQCAQCVPFTKNLLEKIYGCDCIMDDRNITNLKRAIYSQLSKLREKADQLWLAVKGNASESDIHKLRQDLLDQISPDSQFSAFKRTYMEELCDTSSNAKAVFEEILNHPSLHPPTPPISCCHVG
jgi:hypothetical protein